MLYGNTTATYKYTPYYRNDGLPDPSPFEMNCLRMTLSIGFNSFLQDVRTSFEDVHARDDTEDDNIVSVTADLSRAECDERVMGCLSSLGLYAKTI